MRVALGILAILGGIVLVTYGIQGKWPIDMSKGTEPLGTRPGGKPPEPLGPRDE